MYYDTKQNEWHESRETLPERRGNTVGLCAAPDSLLASLGIIKGVQDAVPAGEVGTGGYIITVADGVAHRTPITIDAQEQAEQAAAQFAAMAAKALPMVKKLDNLLRQVGLSIPTTEEKVKAVLMALDESPQNLIIGTAISTLWDEAVDTGIDDHLESILETEAAQ